MEKEYNNKMKKTHVRYRVNYNDRNYEYVLHSAKKSYLRNLADVVNIIEYCANKNIKNGDSSAENLYNYNVIRLVNDVPSPADDDSMNNLKNVLDKIVTQILNDYNTRNK